MTTAGEGSAGGQAEAPRGSPTAAFFGPAGAGLRGAIAVPGDKSVSHRSVLMGAINSRSVRVRGFLSSADTLATVAAVRALGTAVDVEAADRLTVHGTGWEGLKEPEDVIDVRNAGTLIRLLPGIVASRDMLVVLTGDASIRRRPMARIIQPLQAMGAAVWGRAEARLPPIAMRGGQLKAIEHRMEVASAQVKSCVLLAGLRAQGETAVIEPGPTRDHTERLIRLGGGTVERDGPLTTGGTVRVAPLPGPLTLPDLQVPGDLSSAAFLLVAALLVPDSRVTVRDVGLNPTRTGILDVLAAMGGRLSVVARAEEPTGPTPPDAAPGGPEMSPWGDAGAGEPIGGVTAETSELTAVDVGGDEVALMIDEVPVWALAAARARGMSRLRGAAELRVKESDRLAAIASLLRVLDVQVVEYDDGLDIVGRPDGWKGGMVASHGDHRLAMVGAVAGLVSREGVSVDDCACIDVSFPTFEASVRDLIGDSR